MKSLPEYILEAYEKPSKFFQTNAISFIASLGERTNNDSKKIDKEGELGRQFAKNAGGYPIFPDLGDICPTPKDLLKINFEEDNIETYKGGWPVYKDEASSKLFKTLSTGADNIDVNDDYRPRFDPKFGHTYRDNHKQSYVRWKRTYKTFDGMLVIDKFKLMKSAYERMLAGKVIYWRDMNDDPGGAIYDINKISSSHILAFEYNTDTDWLTRGTDFEPIFCRNIDDDTTDRMNVFVCRFFKNKKAAEYWKECVNKFYNKDDRDVFIIDFNNPSPAAVRFLEKHTSIRAHKSPGIYGKRYGDRKGVMNEDLLGMDQLMKLVREFRGDKEKKPWDRYHDLEREVVWKNGDPDSGVLKNMDREKISRKCSHSTFNTSHRQFKTINGIEVETYLATCVKCDYTEYGFDVNNGEYTGSGYKTRGQALDAAKAIAEKY